MGHVAKTTQSRKKGKPVHLPASGPRSANVPTSGGRGSEQGGEGVIPAGEQLLDPKGVGKRLKLSPRTVSEMANDGRLPAYRIGIYLRFKWVEVEQHLAATCKLRAALATNS
jgi:excisionase family DNA binding protein